MYVYLVKEVQYEWVTVVKAFKTEAEAKACVEEFKMAKQKVGILNYTYQKIKVDWLIISKHLI